MRFFLFTFAIFFVLSFSGGDDPYVELEKIATNWNHPKSNIVCRIDMYYYGDTNTKIAIDSMSLLMEKKGDKSYVRSDEFEFLELGASSVYVDVLSESIHVFDYPDDLGKVQLDVVEFIDMAKRFEGFQVKIKKGGNGLASIVFSAPDHSNTKIVLEYDTESYLVQKIESVVALEGEPSFRLMLGYRDYQISQKSFSYMESSFVKRDGAELVAKLSRHKGFKVFQHAKK